MSTSWKAKLALAKAEVDPRELPGLVREAEVAIFQRVIELAFSTDSSSEREEILHAANELIEIDFLRIDEVRPKLLKALNVRPISSVYEVPAD